MHTSNNNYLLLTTLTQLYDTMISDVNMEEVFYTRKILKQMLLFKYKETVSLWLVQKSLQGELRC